MRSGWSIRTDHFEELNRSGPGDFASTLLAWLKEDVGAQGIRLMFADVEERLLITWGEEGSEGGEIGRAMIDGSIHGRVYVSGRAERAEVSGSPVIIAPVVVRSERLGVIEVRFAEEPERHAEDVVRGVALLAGYVAVAGDRWTDEFHVARRRQDMTLAAELQWTLLPLAAFSTARISLAGALEPAYDIAGDCFDYACGRKYMTAGIFDAMGHGVRAARLTDLAVAAFRNARRSGKPLGAQARLVHDSVAEHSADDAFVTGQLLAVDLVDPGRSRIVNAGHPPPLVQRGSRPPSRLPLLVDYPFGIAFANELSTQPLELKPGDRLTLFSDGVIEARPDEGQPYGMTRLREALKSTRGLAPREATRRIIASVRQHRAADLTDDATILIIDIPLEGSGPLPLR
jgi:hypothetical protein